MKRSNCTSVSEAASKWNIPYVALLQLGAHSQMDLHMLIAGKSTISAARWMSLCLAEKSGLRIVK